jgi:conjugative transfer signal peptidase TraF
MIDARKERHGTVEVADPDLVGAGVEVERAFFVNLGGGIRWGKDFDADLGRSSEYDGSLDQLGPATVEPHEVNGFDTVSGGKRAFGESTTVGEEGLQQVGNLALAVGVGESWRWTHDDVAVSIGFDPIGEFGQSRIGQDFGPPGNVKRGLSLEIWKLDGDGHEVTKSMKVPRKQRVKRFGALAIGCLGGLVLLCAVCQAGLRINGTHSEPVGIYWAISKAPSKGDFVFALPPAEPIFKLAKERGYLAAGPSPAGTCAVIKQVAAVCGDRVTIDEEGVRLKNSAPRPVDQAGRTLCPYYLRDYTLGADELLLMSDYSPASFDGRYFGPLSRTTIQSVIVPILTWK